MRILFTLTYYTPHWTGLTEHARRLAEALATKNYDVAVVATQHDSSLATHEYLHAVEIFRTSVWFRLSRTLISPMFFSRVWQEMRKADVVIAYTPLAEVLLIAIFCRLQGKRLILIHNGDLILPKGIGNRIVEKIFDITSYVSGLLATKIIAYSDDYARNSRFLKHFLDKTTAILPLFPEQKTDKSTENRLQKKLPEKAGPVIGFAGRFVEEKGFDILFKAIPEVMIQYPHAIFVFAGETKMLYEHFFESNEILLTQVQSHFLSLGLLTKEEMPSFYPLLDVFVLPSRSDCLAFVQVEAMLANVPVVATNIPGARVPVQKTEMGELVTVEDPNALARGIVQVLKNKKVYEKKRGQVKELFDYEKTLRQFETILTS